MDGVELEKLVINHERVLNNGLCKAVQDLTEAVKKLTQDREKELERELETYRENTRLKIRQRRHALFAFLAGGGAATIGSVATVFLMRMIGG